VAVRASLISGAASPDVVPTLHIVYLDGHLLGAALIGLTLFSAAACVHRSGLLPRPYATTAVVVGGWNILATATAFTARPGHGWIALTGFAAGVVWIVAVGAYLLMPLPAAPGATLTWLLFFAITLTAGVSGLALLLFPSQTATFFSWPLSPPSAAATI